MDTFKNGDTTVEQEQQNCTTHPWKHHYWRNAESVFRMIPVPSLDQILSCTRHGIASFTSINRIIIANLGRSIIPQRQRPDSRTPCR